MATSPEQRDVADWKFVYIAEAHAMSEWPVRSGRFNRGRGAVIVEHQPRTSAERCRLAQRFAKDFDLALDSAPDNVELLVDNCEKSDPFEKAYAPWPLRLYVIRDGTMDWIAEPKDCSYDDAIVDLMAMLQPTSA